MTFHPFQFLNKTRIDVHTNESRIDDYFTLINWTELNSRANQPFHIDAAVNVTREHF